SGVQNLRSTSIQGLSVVTVFFGPSSDIYRDRQVVAERLAVAAHQLPQGVQPPAMTPLTSSTSTVLVIGLTSQAQSLMKLRTIARRPGRRKGGDLWRPQSLHPSPGPPRRGHPV